MTRDDREYVDARFGALAANMATICCHVSRRFKGDADDLEQALSKFAVVSAALAADCGSPPPPELAKEIKDWADSFKN